MRSGFAALVLLIMVGSLPAVGLDPSGFSLVGPSGGGFQPEFSSTVGFSMLSGGGRTLASGTYVGTMSFQLHPRLRADLDLGYSRLYDFHGSSSGRILGAVNLEWKPSDTFTFMVHCSGTLPDSSLTGI